MSGQNRRKELRPPGKCIFCDKTGLSRTHIWPDWLGRLLPFGDSRVEEHISDSNPNADSNLPIFAEKRIKQGRVFSLKPLIACEGCNNGWMEKFENEMVKFSKPMFTTDTKVRLNESQVRVFSVWICLITILAEYINWSTRNIIINKEERTFIKKYYRPPDNWKYFLCIVKRAGLDSEIR
jgi:hypothetical protein